MATQIDQEGDNGMEKDNPFGPIDYFSEDELNEAEIILDAQPSKRAKSKGHLKSLLKGIARASQAGAERTIKEGFTDTLQKANEFTVSTVNDAEARLRKDMQEMEARLLSNIGFRSTAAGSGSGSTAAPGGASPAEERRAWKPSKLQVKDVLPDEAWANWRAHASTKAQVQTWLRSTLERYKL